ALPGRGASPRRPLTSPMSFDSRHLGRLLDRFEFVGLEFDSSCLGDKVQPQQNRRHAVALLDPPLDAAQCAGLYFNSRPNADLRRQIHFQARVERAQNFTELLDKQCLIMDREQVRYMITLKNLLLLRSQELQEYVTGKQRLVERDGFASIF